MSGARWGAVGCALAARPEGRSRRHPGPGRLGRAAGVRGGGDQAGAIPAGRGQELPGDGPVRGRDRHPGRDRDGGGHRRRWMGWDRQRIEALLQQFRGAAFSRCHPCTRRSSATGGRFIPTPAQGQELASGTPGRHHPRVDPRGLVPAGHRPAAACAVRRGPTSARLAADLGRAAGPGAHLQACAGRLRAVSPGAGDRSLMPWTPASRPGSACRSCPLADALAHLPARWSWARSWVLPLTQGKRVASGQLGGPSAGRHRLLRHDGTLLAVADLQGEFVRLERVFATEPVGQGNATAPGPVDDDVAVVARLSNDEQGSFPTGLCRKRPPACNFHDGRVDFDAVSVGNCSLQSKSLKERRKRV